MANCGFVLFFLISCFQVRNIFADEKSKTDNSENGFEVKITKAPAENCERKAAANDFVAVHYTGKLKDSGKEFDSSRTRNKPHEFVLGRGAVIEGWEKGIKGMCIGEQRQLIIPPDLAYGDQGYADLIPAKSTLVFDVELMDIKDWPKQEEKKIEDYSVEIEVTKDPPENCARKAQDDDHISVHYDGYLKDGKEFDSSRKRNQPFDVILGRRQVIPGWEQGLKGMCVGEQRKLTIPPELAYGDQGFSDIIPPKSTLVFDVELMSFKDRTQPNSQVKVEITKAPPENCKRKAQENDQVSVHYTGYHKDGQEFDSSRKREEPLVIVLGREQVIPGWEQGIKGMCVGEERKLTIPPELAYGDNGIGEVIPGGSTLIFDIELMDIQDAPAQESSEGQHQPEDTFELIDTNNDRSISWEEMTAHVKLRPQDSDGETPTETIVSEIFQEDDKNKDGIISYHEFFGSIEERQPYSTEAHEEL